MIESKNIKFSNILLFGIFTFYFITPKSIYSGVHLQLFFTFILLFAYGNTRVNPSIVYKFLILGTLTLIDLNLTSLLYSVSLIFMFLVEKKGF